MLDPALHDMQTIDKTMSNETDDNMNTKVVSFKDHPHDEGVVTQEQQLEQGQQLHHDHNTDDVSPTIEPSSSVEIVHKVEERTPEISQFKDHFTLLIPSSTVRYREGRAAARILEAHDAQFVLEETYDKNKDKHSVSIRRIHDTSEGLRVLRTTYLIVTAFWTGFLFIFCLQILLFLFLDLAIQAGATSKQQPNWGKAIGVIVAFPGFVFSLSCCLVIAGAYIMDTYRGHLLIRNFTFRNLRQTVVEWIFFAFFLGLPILCMCLTLLARLDNWWEITSLFWVGSVAFFYVLFGINVIFYEMKACWDVTKNMNGKDNESWFALIKSSILTRQVHMYSGRTTFSYLAMGTIQDAEYTDSASHRNMVVPTYEEHMSLRSKLTLWKRFSTESGGWLAFFDRIEPRKERIYDIDDARDVRPYMTSYTWSLEKIFCRPKNSRYIAIVRGPGALTQAQIRSSVACSFIGAFLIFFIFFSALVYLQLGVAFTLLMVAVACIVSYPTMLSTYKLYQTRNDLTVGYSDIDKSLSPDDTDAGANLVDRRENDYESECVYFVQEVYRISRPTKFFCWFMFCFEIIVFYIYPLIALFSVNNYPLGAMFAILVGVSLLRYYVNAAVVLEECGRMDLVDGVTEYELWKNQSRLNEIVGNITRGRSLGVWISVLGSLGFAFLALMLGAVGSGAEDEAIVEAPKTFLYDFEFQQVDSLRYPTCQLSNDLGAAPLKTMADYAFLAGLAYRSPNNTQGDLDGWFGPGVALDNIDVVETYRSYYNVTSAVSFKLVTFPDSGNFAYVLIRGTTNNWDMLTDAQLWSAAALLQVHRALLPLGLIWTPIFDQLIRAITKIESASIESVSFYKDTTAFVNFLLNQTTTYRGVSVTGHSLGGGLSIITGAQTGVPAVALSGPNAMLSRRSFDPPISQEALDSKTFVRATRLGQFSHCYSIPVRVLTMKIAFYLYGNVKNIIPARDIVPMIDDVAQNFQHIRCEAGTTDVIGCHNSIRSLCEIIYSCGSRNRPVLCSCVTEFGYPEPTPKSGTNRTFAEACSITIVDEE